MRGGRLDRRITIQRKTTSLDNAGEPSESWTDLTTVWAEVRGLTGQERINGEHLVAQEQVQFRIRWSTTVDDVSPLDQISFNGEIYDIIQATPVGRNEAIQILAVHFTNS